MSDRWQYLIVLGLCLAITAPLEMFGTGVYRQPGRLVRAIVPVAVAFLVECMGQMRVEKMHELCTALAVATACD